MNIEYFNLVKYSNDLKRYSLETPSHVYINYVLEEYIVKDHEEMRFDLIIESMYESTLYYEYLDVILYINDIDNPLNVLSGKIILYPPKENLDSYRMVIQKTEILGDNNKNMNGNHTKVNRVDKNRADFINNNYTLNPVQSPDNQGSIKMINNSVVISGLNSN